MVTKQANGKLKQAGKSLIWVAPTEDEKGQIRAAAAIQGKPMSQFVLDLALEANRQAESRLAAWPSPFRSRRWPERS